VASHQKHFRLAAIALSCGIVLVASAGASSAQTTKRSVTIPQSSRHDTGRLKSAPPQGSCVDPRPGNPGIPCWVGGCGQCGFQG
jgi:hypothetical protein